MRLPQAQFDTIRDRMDQPRPARPAHPSPSSRWRPPRSSPRTRVRTVESTGSAFDVFRKSGVIGILIVVLSIVALAVIIENMVLAQGATSSRRPSSSTRSRRCSTTSSTRRRWSSARTSPPSSTRICGAGISKIGHDFEVIEQSITEMGDEESIRLHQKIGWLSLIANVAPMMGLLGTVGGMIKSFNVIAAARAVRPTRPTSPAVSPRRSSPPCSG